MRIQDFLNGKIEVHLIMQYIRGQSYAKDLLKDAERQILRHVDGVASVIIHAPLVCSHCRYTWDVDETGLPQCCDKAQEEFRKEKANASIAK